MAYESWVEKGEPEGKMSCVELLVPRWSLATHPSKLTSPPGTRATALLFQFSFALPMSPHTLPLRALTPHSSYFFFFHSGGAQYDQNHIILNTVNTEKLTQVWEAMVL